MIFSQNLKYLRKEKSLTQVALAKELGLTRSSLAAYEEGRSEPKFATLKTIAEFFRVPLGDLLEMDLRRVELEKHIKHRKQKKHAKGKETRVLSITVDEEGQENIEFVTEKASAGYTRGYADPEYIRDLPKYRLPFLAKDRTYRAFEISGDSMLPIPSGSIVIGEYTEDWATVREGGTCVVVSRNDGVVLKNVHNRIEKRGTLLLKSSNIHYTPYEIPVDEVQEVWRFVAYISREIPDSQTSVDDLRVAFEQLREEVQEIKTDKKQKRLN
ncbi:MAG: LexA family transcriptional regulator [Bacteroidota bacterium]